MSGADDIRRAYEQARVLSDGGEAGATDEGIVTGDLAKTENSEGPALASRKRKRKQAAAADDDGGGGEADKGGFSVDDINREFSLVLLGSRAIVMQQCEEGPLDERQRILSVEAFQIWFGNRFLRSINARGDSVLISFANAWLRHPDRQQYQGVEFYPDPQNRPGARGRLNLWRGFAYAPCAKVRGYKTFADHLMNNVCGGVQALYDWVFAFFAQMVQRPRERIGVALVLRGGMGSGKTVVGEHIGALFPSHYFLVDDPRYVTGQFNAHMASCLLLQADEAVWAGDKGAEGRLKGLVTSPVQQIEAKGVDPIRLDNYVRLIMTSNESWVVPAGRDERRFCVLDVDPRCAQNSGYFGEMRAELRDGGYAALLHDLLTFDLSLVDLRTIPKTSALLDQKERSLDSVPAWWLDRLEAGALTHKSGKWVREVRREVLFIDYIEASDRTGVRRKREETIFGRELRALVPGLGVARRLDTDGSRPRFYLLPPLRECRAAWDDLMGQARKWGDDGSEDDE